MTTDVNAIKDQFARFLETSDWRAFKMIAEYYLQSAVKLKKKEIRAPGDAKLWIRNSIKRLLIGVGCELLLKSFYLREGYCINKPKRCRGISSTPTHRLEEINRDDFDHRDTYSFGTLVDKLKSIHQFQSHSQIERAFRIAMVFRNKEGHTTFLTHNFDPQNYTDVEAGLVLFYQEAFDERLRIQISMEKNEPGVFELG